MPWSNRRTALQNYFAQRREQRHPLTWKAIDFEQECLESAEDAALDEKLKANQRSRMGRTEERMTRIRIAKGVTIHINGIPVSTVAAIEVDTADENVPMLIDYQLPNQLPNNSPTDAA